METKYYTVARIDGDYAWLARTDAPEEDLLIVARALLPEDIDEPEPGDGDGDGGAD